MKKTLFQFALLTALSLGILSCKTQQTAQDSSGESTSLENAEEAEDKNEGQTERSFFASIDRSPCFGTCPVYTMTIYSDGFAELTGVRHIDLIGNFTTQLDEQVLQNIRDRATLIGFADMDEKYDGPVTDLPSATTSIMIDGEKKEVYRRFNYPRSILTLEKLFDDLLTTQDWTKVDAE